MPTWTWAWAIIPMAWFGAPSSALAESPILSFDDDLNLASTSDITLESSHVLAKPFELDRAGELYSLEVAACSDSASYLAVGVRAAAVDGQPDALLVMSITPAPSCANSEPVTFRSTPVSLDARQRYWAQLWAVGGSGRGRWRAQADTSEDLQVSADGGTTWTSESSPRPSLKVYIVSSAPVAVDDSFDAKEDTILRVESPGLFANDHLDPTTAIVMRDPLHGHISLLDHGGFAYVPEPEFVGTDSFEYVGANGQEGTVAVATIVVAPLNDPPSFVPGSNPVVFEDEGPITLEGWATQMDAGPGEGDQTLTFYVLNVAVPQLFAAPPAITPDGTLTFTPARDAFGTAAVVVELRDDGGVEGGGSNASAPTSFEITINSVNDAPSFVKGDDLRILEDCEMQSIAGWATQVSAGPNGEQQPIGFEVTHNTDESLFATPPLVDHEGTLRFEPAPDASGVAEITIVLIDADGARSPPQTFAIRIESVNDAPRFVPGSDLQVVGGGASYVFEAWATEISPGPTDEQQQAVSFEVSTDRPDLFIDQPTISADGTLAFSTAFAGAGTARVTVLANDDGIPERAVGDTPVTTFHIEVVDPAPATDSALTGGCRSCRPPMLLGPLALLLLMVVRRRP